MTAAPADPEEVTFYVRITVSGPPGNLARAARYAKENVGRATDSLKAHLGVDSSVTVYDSPNDLGEYARAVSVSYGDAEEAPLGLLVQEIDE